MFDKDARIFVASKDLDQIIPRWEWRTFSASLAALERAIGPLADVAPRYSSEIYILSLHGPQNAKLRDGLIDIRRLQQVDDDGLELWEPVFKAKFPLGHSDIAVAFSEWHLPLPALSRESYTIEEFFNLLIAAQPALRVARSISRAVASSSKAASPSLYDCGSTCVPCRASPSSTRIEA